MYCYSTVVPITCNWHFMKYLIILISVKLIFYAQINQSTNHDFWSFADNHLMNGGFISLSNGDDSCRMKCGLSKHHPVCVLHIQLISVLHFKMSKIAAELKHIREKENVSLIRKGGLYGLVWMKCCWCWVRRARLSSSDIT